MKINFEHIPDYLAQILHKGINLTVSDLDKLDSIEEKELAYGLICLSEDLDYYKRKSDTTIANLKSALFNSSAVAITDKDGAIKSVNELFIDMSGYSEDELIGSTFRIVKSGYHDLSYYEDMWNTISKGNVWHGEFCNKNKKGEVFWVYTHIFPVKDDHGKVAEFWSIRNDITKKKIIETQLKESNEKLKKALEAKNYLMKEMHHRIKNNLQLLSSMLKLKIGSSDDKESQAILDIISRINSIASIHEMFFQNADQNSINLLEYFQRTFTRSRINLPKKTLLSIVGVECFVTIESCTYIGIVINELITNSIKHAWNDTTIAHSIIKIQLEIKDDLLLISYSDNGTGFLEDHEKEGLGSILIDMLIGAQLEGSYEITSNGGFSIVIKLPHELILDKTIYQNV